MQSKYNKSDHTIYRNGKGEEVPSVTTLLKVLNKPSLVYWANYLGFRGIRVDDELERTATLGTMIHRVINNILEHKYTVYMHDPRALFSKEEVYAGLNSFAKWYKTVHEDFELIIAEKSLSNNFFGGTLDCFAKIDGVYTLVDFKSGKNIYPSMFLQLGLYTVLLEENGYKVERAGIVLANPMKAKNKFVSREELQPYIDLALLLVDVFHKNYAIENQEF